METKLVLPQCRIEEIPVIGGFVITRVEKDLADINQAAPDIDQAYLDGLKAKQETVRNMVTTGEKLGEQKVITRNMYAAMDGLKPKLNLFEIKLNRAAAELNKPIADFGLSKLRGHLKKRNAEAALSAISILLRDIDSNLAALELKGFTGEMREEYVVAQGIINTCNGLQNEKIDERAELSQENKFLIGDYWKGIAGLMRICRLLYKQDPVKLKEYTFTTLLRRVRNERKKAEQRNEVVSGENGVAAEGGVVK